MFQILHFQGGDPLNHSFEYKIHAVSHVWVYMHLHGPSQSCSFLDLFMYLFISISHCQVMSISFSVIPTVTSSRMDFMVTTSSFSVTWLRASVAALSLPFWYLMLKVNLASDATQWCQVASKLGVIMMYVSILLSVLMHSFDNERFPK